MILLKYAGASCFPGRDFILPKQIDIEIRIRLRR